MKQYRILLMIFFLLLLLNLQVLSETKVLIIGVGDYEEDAVNDLPTAVNDARELAATLQRLNIVSKDNLTLLLNPRHSDMVYTISQWVIKANENDSLIFYFGGHSQQAKNRSGKIDIYLLPADFRQVVLTQTAYNFRENWEDNLSEEIKAKETLMIFDTCYAGGISEARGLKDPQFRSLEFDKMAEERNINFLFSSRANQKSKEMPERQGGWFTYYLLEGIGSGAANYNKDLTIDAEEISRYLKERVTTSTDGQQTPESILGKKDMKVAQDESLTYERIKSHIAIQYLAGKIPEKYSKTYIRILEQNPLKDTEKEETIRQYLIKYYNDRDTIALEAVTERLMSGWDEAPQELENAITESDITQQPNQIIANPQQEEQKEEQQQLQEPIQRQGTCYLKLTANNEKAKGAQIYIDGDYEGTLAMGTLLVERLTKAAHIITIDGEKIEREEIEIIFDNDWMMLTKTIEAQPAKRKLLIITNPPGVTIKVNGKQESEKTPVMIEVIIEEDHKLTLTKDGYQQKELNVKEDRKGEPKRIETTLIKNKAPNNPILIAPTGTEEETITELKWYCTDAEDDALTYDVYLAETGKRLEKVTTIQANKRAENSYSLKNLQPNTNYTWQIIAKDEWKQTEGTIWQFKTRAIITKQIKIETEPTNADIFINNIYTGTSPLHIELKEGHHIIEARKAGYQSKSGTKTIGEQTKDLSRVQILNIELEQETGRVYIQSTPNEAMIYVDGNYKGTTSKTIEGLEPGTHTIKLIKSEYKVTTQTIEIKVGEKTNLNVTLEKPETMLNANTSEQVLVKNGTFKMGNTRGDNEGDDDEKPIQTVQLTYDYYMGKTEITNEEYLIYLNHSDVNSVGSSKGKENIDMDDNDCEISYRNESFYLEKGEKNAPVIEITWWGAISYCNWLSEKEGFANAYDSNGNLLDRNGRQTTDITKVEGYRLPTEAEWEYAAREGHKRKVSSGDYNFSGSYNINSVAWYKINSNDKTHEVGQKFSNELGLFDMSGNVWEWCQDWYGSYKNGIQINPIGFKDTSSRVLRGGSWFSTPDNCRLSNRNNYFPSNSTSYLGFRIARTNTDF